MPKVNLLLLLCVVNLVLSGCGSSQPTIVGEIVEYGEYPIVGRKIALCQIPDSEDFESCTLLETVAVSDEKGLFEFRDLTAGAYILFYDSGLSDFDAAMEKWAGQSIRIGDTKWLLDSFLEEDNPRLPLFSELANLLATRGMERTQFYMALNFMLGDSPFILAHDVARMMNKNEESIIVAVAGEKNQEVKFPALYLKR